MRKPFLPLKKLIFAILFHALLTGCSTSILTDSSKKSDEISRIAEQVTVKIDGIKQGSGVLVSKDGDRYTVLTAWHVVEDVNPGEEFFVYTTSGKKYPMLTESITQVSNVDMGLISFNSGNDYDVATIGPMKSASSGNIVYVSGFPLPTSAVPNRIRRFLEGKVIANSNISIPKGYQLLYSNATLPGMSGGGVFNSRGQIVAIHGQGETSAQMSEQTGIAIKTWHQSRYPYFILFGFY